MKTTTKKTETKTGVDLPVMIPIAKIKWDDRYYPRFACDRVTVHKYTDAMRANGIKTFPPVVVGRGDGCYYGLDGRHRCEAMTANEQQDIYAYVVEVPESQWLAIAVKANTTHGKQLTGPERLALHNRLVDAGYSSTLALKMLCMTGAAFSRMAENATNKAAAEELRGPAGNSEAARNEHAKLARARRVIAEMLELLRDGIDTSDPEIVSNLRILESAIGRTLGRKKQATN